MRIALPHFAFEMSPPQFAHWRSELQSWRRRARERGELARMSDGELHDIGDQLRRALVGNQQAVLARLTPSVTHRSKSAGITLPPQMIVATRLPE